MSIFSRNRVRGPEYKRPVRGREVSQVERVQRGGEVAQLQRYGAPGRGQEQELQWKFYLSGEIFVMIIISCSLFLSY